MSPSQQSGGRKALDVRCAADALCDRFEEQWRQGPQPNLDAFVPPGGPLRAATLVELVLLDLEYRYRSSQPISAQSYGERYPELQSDAEAMSRIMAAEARLSTQRQGDSPTQQSNSLSATNAGAAAPADDVVRLLAPAQAGDEMGRLGSYRVLKVLGSGGMGIVFLAEDPLLKRAIALKVMKPSVATSVEARERFLREAQATAQIEHDNIIPIHQVAEERGVPFLAMPLLKGRTVLELLRDNPRPPLTQVLRIARQTASGLAAAHAAGLVHRDIKPSNLWLEPTDGGRVKILDFGLARPVEQDQGTLTQSGVAVGTPAYMAPEQARGEMVDGRADLFSLGCVLYEMTTGQRPFRGNTAMALVMAIAAETPTPVAQLCPAAPPGLVALIDKLLAKDREQRPASATMVAEELARIEHDLLKDSDQTTRKLDTTSTPAHKSPRRCRWLIAAGMLGVVAAAVLAGILLLKPSPDKPDSGTMEIVTDDESIEVTIKQKDGKEIVLLVDKHNKRTLELAATDGEISARELPDGQRFKTSHYTITRGEKVVFSAKMLLPEVQPLLNENAAAPTEAISPLALVRTPIAIKGLRSWTVETRNPRGAIHAVAYDPHGDFLAAGSADGLVRIYDARTRELLHILTGHLDTVVGLSWSPDGKQLASCAGENDKTINIWEPATGRIVHVLRGHLRGVGAIAWSPDGQTIASAGLEEKIIRLWSPVTGKETDTLRGHKGTVRAIAWSPDNKMLASASEDKTVRLWDAVTGECRRTFVGESAITSVTWAPDARTVASAEDRCLRLWPLDGTPPTILGMEPNRYHRLVSWSSDGSKLLSGTSDGYDQQIELRFWDAKSNELINKAWSGGTNIASFAWSPDRKTVAVGYASGSLRLWDSRSGELNVVMARSVHLSSALSPDGKTLAVVCPLMDGSDKHIVQLWQADSGQLLRTLEGPGAAIICLVWSPDSKKLAYDANGFVQVWDTRTGQNLHTFTNCGWKMHNIAWAPDGRKLAYYAIDNTLRLYDPDSGKLLRALQGLPGRATVAWSPDSSKVAAGYDGGPIRIWNSESGTMLHNLDTGSVEVRHTIAWSPAGSSIADGVGTSVCFWGVDTWQKARSWATATGWTETLDWSPDGKTIVVMDWASRLFLFDVQSGKLLQKFPVQAAGAIAISWTQDSKVIVIGYDGASTIQFRSAITGNLVGSTLLLLPKGQYLILSPNGHYRASAEAEHEFVYVTETDQGQEMLTAQEFARKYNWKNDPEHVPLLGK